MDEKLERALAVYEDIGGPGNSQAEWKILKLLIDYLRERDGQGTEAEAEPPEGSARN